MKYKLSYAETPFEIKYWKYGCPELLKECIKEYIIDMDFVTYEIAKKLKEKGFPQHIAEDAYIVDNYGEDEYQIGDMLPIQLIPDYMDDVAAPTIYQVLKWLREEKDIFIQLEYINQKACGCTIIKQKTGGLIAKWNWDKFQYVNKNHLVGNTYEQAAIGGIAYVLDNLI